MFKCRNRQYAIFLLMVGLLIASFLLVRNTNAQDYSLGLDMEHQLSCEGKELKVFSPPAGYQQTPIKKAMQMENYSPTDQNVQSIETKLIDAQRYPGK